MLYDDTRQLYTMSSKKSFIQAESAAVASPLADLRGTFKHKRYLENVLELDIPGLAMLPQSSPQVTGPSLPIPNRFSSSTATPTTTSSENVVTGTLDPAQARAKTSQASKCTPSPTTSMAPKASE
jgi:hypothetical protein